MKVLLKLKRNEKSARRNNLKSMLIVCVLTWSTLWRKFPEQDKKSKML